MERDISKLSGQKNEESVVDRSELEEFSIAELEERLEFLAWCNNC